MIAALVQQPGKPEIRLSSILSQNAKRQRGEGEKDERCIGESNIIQYVIDTRAGRASIWQSADLLVAVLARVVLERAAQVVEHTER